MKATLQALVAAFAAAAVIGLAVRHHVLSRAAAEEEDEARQNLERALAALAEERTKLEAVAEDYSAWDRTYEYVASRDATFLGELPTARHTSLNIDVIALFDLEGGLVHGRRLDHRIRHDEPLPRLLAAALGSRGPRPPRPSGLVATAEHVLLVARRPILTSQADGPERGQLVIGRFVDDTLLDQLTRSTRFTVHLRRFSDPELPPQWTRIRDRVRRGERVVVERADDDLITATTLVDDVVDAPALLVRVDGLRRLHRHTRRASAALVVTGIVCGALGAVAALAIAGRSR